MEVRVGEDELQARLNAAQAHVTVGGQYKHYKGAMYRVVSLALLEGTNEVCVLYQAQYGKQLTFIRPLAVWLQTVVIDGRAIPRFIKMV